MSEESTWSKFLADKQAKNSRIKVYLTEKNQVIQQDRNKVEFVKTNNIMLSGFIDEFEETSIRLVDKECLIERGSIMSIKAD